VVPRVSASRGGAPWKFENGVPSSSFHAKSPTRPAKSAVKFASANIYLKRHTLEYGIGRRPAAVSQGKHGCRPFSINRLPDSEPVSKPGSRDRVRKSDGRDHHRTFGHSPRWCDDPPRQCVPAGYPSARPCRALGLQCSRDERHAARHSGGPRSSLRPRKGSQRSRMRSCGPSRPMLSSKSCAVAGPAIRGKPEMPIARARAELIRKLHIRSVVCFTAQRSGRAWVSGDGVVS
jgi:hypothetical protein